MSRKYGTLFASFLNLAAESYGLPWPIEGSEGWRRKQIYQERSKYKFFVHHAKKRGLVKEVRFKGKTFLRLTEKGELQMLLNKMGTVKQEKWDGKWRMLIFDIPEDAREKRDQLRWLLRKHGFIKLQASVFVHPFSLNRESILYLKNSGLMPYIRIAKIEEFDDDKDLRKKFRI